MDSCVVYTVVIERVWSERVQSFKQYLLNCSLRRDIQILNNYLLQLFLCHLLPNIVLILNIYVQNCFIRTLGVNSFKYAEKKSCILSQNRSCKWHFTYTCCEKNVKKPFRLKRKDIHRLQFIVSSSTNWTVIRELRR